ncbi:hypothetical protein THOM_2340, partial [Trachipleistophora hominis]
VSDQSLPCVDGRSGPVIYRTHARITNIASSSTYIMLGDTNDTWCHKAILSIEDREQACHAGMGRFKRSMNDTSACRQRRDDATVNENVCVTAPEALL